MGPGQGLTLRRPALALLFAAGAALAADATEPLPLPVVEIHMPSPCLGCIDWGSYLAENGFRVVYKETADMAAVKRRFKVPVAVQSDLRNGVHDARQRQRRARGQAGAVQYAAGQA